jgi:hypothetical protein
MTNELQKRKIFCPHFTTGPKNFVFGMIRKVWEKGLPTFFQKYFLSLPKKTLFFWDKLRFWEKYKNNIFCFFSKK